MNSKIKIPSTSSQLQAEVKEDVCLQHDILDFNKLSSDFTSNSGGQVSFVGRVRDINIGKQVSHLFYEAYEAMANKMIRQIINEAKAKFDLTTASCIHRLGQVEIHEIAIIVNTASVHRKEAFEANQYIVDRVKHEGPIWKREFYTDGSHSWSLNCNCASH